MNQVEHRRFETEWRKMEAKLAGYFFRKGCPEEDVEDLVQETAYRSYKNFSTLIGDFSFWVWGIASHVFLDYLRKQRKTNELDEENEPSNVQDPGNRTISRVLMEACLKLLDPIDRKCLILHDLGGKNLEEISKILGISVSNAHYHVKKARTTIREYFPELVQEGKAGAN